MPLIKLIKQNSKEPTWRILTAGAYYIGLFSFVLRETDDTIKQNIHKFLNDPELVEEFMNCFLESGAEIPKMEHCVAPLIEPELYKTYELSWALIPLILIGIELLMRGLIFPACKFALSEEEKEINHSALPNLSERATLLPAPVEQPQHSSAIEPGRPLRTSIEQEQGSPALLTRSISGQ